MDNYCFYCFLIVSFLPCATPKTLRLGPGLCALRVFDHAEFESNRIGMIWATVEHRSCPKIVPNVFRPGFLSLGVFDNAEFENNRIERSKDVGTLEHCFDTSTNNVPRVFRPACTLLNQNGFVRSRSKGKQGKGCMLTLLQKTVGPLSRLIMLTSKAD